MDLNDKDCNLIDGTAVSCVNIEFQMKYNGVGIPEQIGELPENKGIKNCPFRPVHVFTKQFYRSNLPALFH